MYLSFDGFSIPKGNFAFLYDVARDADLFDSFFEAEKHLKTNCKDFAHKIRMAYEAFALYEYTLAEFSKQQLAGGPVQSKEEIREHIIEEIKKPSSVENYKNLIIDRCRGRESDFAQMLFTHSVLRYPNSDIGTISRMLGKYIRSVYNFGSESSHEGTGTTVSYGDCLKIAFSFYDFLNFCFF